MVERLPDLLIQYCTRPAVVTQAYKEILDFYIATEAPEDIAKEVAHVSAEFLNLLQDEITADNMYRGMKIIPAAGWLPYSGEFDIYVVIMQKFDLGHPMLKQLIPTFNS